MNIALTKKELAVIAGYSYRRLYDIDKNLPADKKLFTETGGGKYDLTLFVQRWVQYRLSKENDGEMSLDEAKAVHERVKIEKTQLEVAQMRGELVSAEEVSRLWESVAKNVVQNLLRLPVRIAQQVYMLDNMDAIIKIIEREIRTTLIGISETPLPSGAGKEGAPEEKED